MKYNLKNYLKIILISLFVFLLLILTILTLKFNYNLGVKYCVKNDIPLDFILPVSGVPFVLGITFTLFVFESAIIYYFVRILKNKY